MTITPEQLEYIERRIASGPYTPATKDELLVFTRTLLDEVKAMHEKVTCSYCGRQRPRLLGVCDVCSMR